VIIQTVGLILAGFWIGWGALIVRGDLKIKKDHRLRKARAAFLSVLLALFMLSLGARGLDKLGIFTASGLLALALLSRRKRLLPRKKKHKKQR